MRVALVCAYDLAVPGGVQNQTLGLGRALLRRGHEVAVLAPGTRVPLGTPALSIELVGRTIGVRANGSVAPIAPFPSVIGPTRRFVASGHFDVVHLEEPFVPGPSLVALLAAGHPLVGTFHRAGSTGGYRALRGVLARLARRIDVAVAVSNEAADSLRAMTGREADRVLPNAIDLDRLCGDRQPRASGAVPRLVFVGRHEHRKGLGVLLAAVKALPEPLELHVIGEGPETEALRTACSDHRVCWRGRIDDEELASALRSADILVAPSLSGESFGVVLLEAMAAGCAVVASDLPGYRLAAGDAASFVPPGDPEALRTRLAALFEDPAELLRLAALGRARAEDYDFGALAGEYEAIYKDLVGRR